MEQTEIRRISSEVVYQNRWMTVREDKIIRPSGACGIFGVVEKRDFAVIAAMQGSQVYLVEQYRYPVGARYWELPQGSWEAQNLDPLVLARAELREETGLSAVSMRHVGHLFMGYGYSTQGYNIYLATELEQGDPDREPEEEGLIAQAFQLDTVEGMILDGVIKDATTVAVLGLMKIKGII